VRVLIASAVFLLVSASSSVAQTVPTVDVIEARLKAAYGPPVLSLQTVIITKREGVRGRRTTYRLGDDYRRIFEEPPFVTQRGRVAKQSWHQNENGQTVIDQGDEGLAMPDHYVATVTAVSSPVAGYAIARLNASGFGSRDVIDSSWHVIRHEALSASGTTVTTYDDFRSVDGATHAWHWTQGDGPPENTTEYSIASESRDVRSSDVAIAKPRRAVFTLPGGTAEVALPARQVRDKFYVRVTIDGRGLDFLLDTGAAGITIDDDVARQLGLTLYGRFSNGANAGRYTGSRVIVPHLAIGPLAGSDIVMHTTPHIAPTNAGDMKPVGLLGFDFIGALALKLDYVHGSVTAYDPASFAAPTAPHTLALDVRLGTQQPMTDVMVNGALGERFIIDTGATAPLALFDYFQRRNRSALVDRGGGGAARNMRFFGVGGAFDVRPYQLDSVKFGTADFKGFLAYAVTSRQAYGLDEDGLIGTQFLNLFDVYLDYANSRVYLEPNELGRAASVR